MTAGSPRSASPDADVPIRDAATLILVRRDDAVPRVLMGQRGAGAVFMPSKFVFPGGRLDTADTAVAMAGALPAACTRRLAVDSPPDLARPLAAAAIRELWEETGLRLASAGAPAPAWPGFGDGDGWGPDVSGLSFVFRAITPPGRPRRFDTRFFLAGADALVGDPDDFSRAGDELAGLRWIGLAEARALDLPFITGIVLAEIEARLAGRTGPQAAVPFFDNRDAVSRFRML